MGARIPIYTVSVDEKPGVQALGLTAPDLPPMPGKATTVGRDYEYVRHGTVSILAGIDLHSGHIFAHTEDRHRSVEFIELLKDIDAYYPPEAIIRRRPRQPFGAYLEGDHGLPRDASWTIRVCSYAQAWILAQPHRVCLLKNGTHLPPPHPCRIR
jgi:hypothetical protein